MPALENHLQLHGCRGHVDGVINVVMRHSLSEVSAFGCEELCTLILGSLGLSADDYAR
jgi:hypothetical protein